LKVGAEDYSENLVTITRLHGVTSQKTVVFVMSMYCLRHEPSSPAQTLVLGSNPTQGMDVCVPLFCVHVPCVGRGLASG
jgi:hypothetical protein